MPYVNIDLDFFDHPKTLLLEAELGGHRASLIPIRLWIHTGKYHSEDGLLKGYSPAAIAKAVHFDARLADKLADSLVKCGFLVKKPTGYLVHDWNQHNGHLAVFRERAKIAAEARWNKSKERENPNPNRAKKEPESVKNDVILTEDQARDIRIALAKKLNAKVFSEAVQTAWDDLSAKLNKAAKKGKIENIFAYAITAAMNYGDSKK